MSNTNSLKTDRVIEVVNPFDQLVIGSVDRKSWDEVDACLSVAHQLHMHRKNWIPVYRRIEILKKTATIMQSRFEELAYQIANEGGKPLIDARVEVSRAIDGVELCASNIMSLAGREIPMDLTAAGAGRLAFTSREPIGVVVAVSAFNHPLNLIVHQVGPAVAAGCPVLVKPADDTPLSCQSFVNILYEAGLAEEWCCFAPCDTPTAEKLVTDPRVAFFSFIGSAKVGWMLRSKLAQGTRCALEHGGAAPVIIDENADIEEMIPKLVKGGYYHSGQVCVSVQRIYAPKKIAATIGPLLAEEVSKLVVGNAVYEETECGPLIRPREVDRVSDWVEEARQAGASVLAGGQKLGATTYAPTVLHRPPLDVSVSQKEIFGPVVCIYDYEAIEDAFTMANSLPFAFQASVFTSSLDTAMNAIRNLDATAVMVNDHTAFRVDWMPFAGRRQSGYGTGGIGYTMHDMTHDKMAIIKL
ncbi:aldehyde dehydrogenase family protein [Pseudovibrio sp. Tun.PSC04-5.I4]|uniref:aldehyde dehydrogenase family protein n=1 Tax=Pseudovibrio sp. Tun.PSC04-5.I4 TaxID=1798213 RepID=UPI000881CD48|nr:aldehyde dehydrogenase family protein [Pseudovibrio sp. Tun.PSC04-5.I4]SDR45648.1 Acyl-CoA reductase [Pseudovibrio sp. Tun.PSC04-5.I4]